MRVFVTGGTGFIGMRLIDLLLKRGDQVIALARSETRAAMLAAQGAQPVLGNILDANSLKLGMQGCGEIFHLAGWYKLGARNQSQAEPINVTGTNNVLRTAWDLGIPKIIYTSSIAVFGNTHGEVADEKYQMLARDNFITEYDRTKWKAHYEIALPLIALGAPVIVIQPGVVYGPGDPSLVGELMRAYYRGCLILFPGPETVLAFTHVDDVAAGLILAAKKGAPGESYILAGPSITLRRAAELWAAATGKRAPLMFVPSTWVHHLQPLASLASKFTSLPELLSVDAIRVLGVSFAARSYKAFSELGWESRPLQQGFYDTFTSYTQNKPHHQVITHV